MKNTEKLNADTLFANFTTPDNPHLGCTCKLSAKSPAIPVIEKKVIPWTLETLPSPLPELVYKATGEICTIAVAKLYHVLISAMGAYSYQDVMRHFTQRKDGTVCGTEVEQ